MKSCRCEECNVSSARYAWGFALLARDGWVVTESSPLAGSLEGIWRCSVCHARDNAQPLGAAKPNVVGKDAQRARSRGVLRILMVDDEEIVRRCTSRVLSDFDVVAVTGGAEALELLSKDSDFDAVLSDVMMPRMSGPQLFAHCFERHPELAQRFVFASGNPEAARVELSQVVDSLGADLPPILLAKPCPREALSLALFAAAAHSAHSSGTFALAAGLTLRVTSNRG